MKALKKPKTVSIIFIILILALTLAKSTMAQASNITQTFFSKKYAGVSINVNATHETVPGGNITIILWLNCTAVDVNVDYIAFDVYGFRHGEEEILLNSTTVMESVLLIFNQTYQYNYTVYVPSDVWGATDIELHIKYTIVDLPVKEDPRFSITVVRNVYLEELEKKFKALNSTYWQLNNTFAQLNQTFWECFGMNLTAESLALLNKTYWGLNLNLSDLDNTRRTVAILGITTAVFVLTTIYLFMRKPKQYW